MLCLINWNNIGIGYMSDCLNFLSNRLQVSNAKCERQCLVYTNSKIYSHGYRTDSSSGSIGCEVTTPMFIGWYANVFAIHMPTTFLTTISLSTWLHRSREGTHWPSILNCPEVSRDSPFSMKSLDRIYLNKQEVRDRHRRQSSLAHKKLHFRRRFAKCNR